MTSYPVRVRAAVPAVALMITGVTCAFLTHRLYPAVGVLTWAVLLGAMIANTTGMPASAVPGIKNVTKKLLRLGIVLLGLSLSVVTVAALGWPLVTSVVACLVATFLVTVWLGEHLSIPRSRVLLIAAGSSICGASAVAATEDAARADEDDVAAAIGLVTLFGSIAMVGLPLLQPVLGLSDQGLGVWAGTSVHEVGQVVAAASPAGAVAVAIAVVVKLTRVLCLAPVVAAVMAWEHHRLGAAARDGRRPRLIPMFVLGFLACVALRSTGAVPEAVLELAAVIQTICLASALFGMGTSVSIKQLFHGSRDSLLLAAASTIFIASVGFGIASFAT